MYKDLSLNRLKHDLSVRWKPSGTEASNRARAHAMGVRDPSEIVNPNRRSNTMLTVLEHNNITIKFKDTALEDLLPLQWGTYLTIPTSKGEVYKTLDRFDLVPKSSYETLDWSCSHIGTVEQIAIRDDDNSGTLTVTNRQYGVLLTTPTGKMIEAYDTSAIVSDLNVCFPYMESSKATMFADLVSAVFMVQEEFRPLFKITN